MKKALKVLTTVVIIGAIGRKVYQLYKDGYFDGIDDFDEEFEDDPDDDLDD